VPNDLVYFTHEGHAGLSAFARGDAGAEERNANFVAVGVLARKDGEYGRLGRSWLIAGRLEGLAKVMAEDESVAPLEEFWSEVQQISTSKSQNNGEEEGQGKDGKGHSRTRAISTGSAVLIKDEEKLPAYHPAKSILGYVDMFGPLVFRLQQAALLRKRILFVGAAPVRAMCEFGKSLASIPSRPTSTTLLMNVCEQFTSSPSSPASPRGTPNSSYPALRTSSVYPRYSTSAYTISRVSRRIRDHKMAAQK
jgi:hypothetical protein